VGVFGKLRRVVATQPGVRHWTEDPALVDGAERFLVKLMGSSEALDPESDHFNPELVPVEYDDAAMWEASEEERLSWLDTKAEEWDDDH
jgi:hypothetical protein